MIDTLLKRALLANAAFSTVSGLALMLLANTLSTLFADVAPLYLQFLGAGLALFAAYVTWVATRTPIDLALAKSITVADWSWVVGSAVLIGVTAGQLSLLGIDLILGAAVIVALFAISQHKGIKKLESKNNEGETDAGFAN